MKSKIRSLTIISFVFISLTFDFHPTFAQTGWYWQNPIPQGNTLSGIHTFAKDSIILAGNVGTLLFSSNGGQDWEQRSMLSGKFNWLRSMQFIEERTGFLVGDTILYKSIDGGKSWSIIFHNDILSAFFISGNTGHALSGDKVYRTFNGGNTWSEQTLSSSFALSKIGFADSLRGWILGYGGTFFQTLDGGMTWTQSGLGNYWGYFGIYFLDRNIGWIVGEAAKIYKTTNGGVNWTEQHTGNNWEALDGIYFKNQQSGWAWGPDLFLYTTNGGTTWSAQSKPVREDINAMQFADSTTGWAIGSNGVILKSSDGGSHWIQQSTTVSAFRINATDWVSDQEGWVSGYNVTAT